MALEFIMAMVLEFLLETKVITLLYKTVVLIDVYSLCHCVLCYSLLHGFCLQITYATFYLKHTITIASVK